MEVIYTHIHICLDGSAGYSMMTILDGYMEKWLNIFGNFFDIKVDILRVLLLLFMLMVAKNRDLSCPH